MQSQINGVKLLINKINTGLNEIQLRSINTLHTKITLGVLDPKILHTYSQLPGVLMNWINQNQNKTEYLYKVINIITYFTHSEKGLLLLKQYQTLQFLQELRSYIIPHFTNIQPLVDLIQGIIRALLPLGKSPQVISQNVNPNCLQSEPKQMINFERQKPHNELPYRNSKCNKQKCQLSFIHLKEVLNEEEQKYIFDLTVQIKYGKKQLQYESLMRIKRFVEVYGNKYFRCKTQLFEQVSKLVEYQQYPWVCCRILMIIIKHLIDGQTSLKKWNQKIINLTKNSIEEPEKVSTTIEIKKNIFCSIYSFEILETLCEMRLDLTQFIIGIQFKYGFKHCVTLLSKMQQPSLSEHNVLSMISYYSKHYPQANYYLIKYVKTPQKIQSLNQYIKHTQSSVSYEYIKGYVRDKIDLSVNLHHINQIIQNLQKGLSGIEVNFIDSLQLYIDCLLFMGIAVSNQDPFMSYYQKAREMIISISNNSSCQVRVQLMGQFQKIIHTQDKIGYIRNQYIKAEVLQIIFTDQILLSKLFEDSLPYEDALVSILQIIKKLQTKPNESLLAKFQTIFYALIYHPSKRVSSLSNFIYTHLSKKSKVKAQLIQLFSQDESVRIAIGTQLFNDTEDIGKLILCESFAKKGLKVSNSTIFNYVNILMNEQLQNQIRKSALNNLVETLERVEITEEIKLCLEDLALILAKKINNKQEPKYQIQYIDLYSLIFQRIKTVNETHLSEHFIISLMQQNLQINPKRRLLRILYKICFQSPFGTAISKSWVMKYYHHLQFIQMDIQKPKLTNSKQEEKSEKLIDQKHKSYRSFMEEVEMQITNYMKMKSDKNGINFDSLDRQINQIFKGIPASDSLTMVYFYLNFMNDKNQQKQQKVFEKNKDMVGPLLNYLCTHENIGYALQYDIIKIITKLPVQINKQIEFFTTSDRPLILKLLLLYHIPRMSIQQLQNVVKNLKLMQPDELLIAFKIIIYQASNFKNLNQFAKMNFNACIMKEIRSKDSKIKSLALYALHKILLSIDCIDTITLLSNSIISCLTETHISLQDFILAIDCLKIIFQKQRKQNKVIEGLANKIILVLKNSNGNYPYIFIGSLISFLNSLLSLGHLSILRQLNMVDLIISFVRQDKINLQKGNEREWMELISNVCEFLTLWRAIEPDINNYLLASTQLLTYLLKICRQDCWVQQNPSKSQLYGISNIGRLLHFLMMKDDYFVFQLNKIITHPPFHTASIFQILSKLCKYGDEEYLKMYSWLVAIEWKGRNCLQQNSMGYQIANIYIKTNHIYEGLSLYAVSFSAKSALVESKELNEIILKAHNIVDCEIMKEVRVKKKYILKVNEETCELKDEQYCNEVYRVINLLSSLFHSSELPQQINIKKEVLKKIFQLVQKLYTFTCHASEVQWMNLFMKLITNLALSKQFSLAFSSYISEGNSIMMEDICNTIIKCQITNSSSKRFLLMLTVLCRHQSVRSMILRIKIIEQLNNRLVRIVEDQKKQPNWLQSLYEMIGFYISLSEYKQANFKIISDKKVLEALTTILMRKKCSLLDQKIINLLQNLACFKQNKSVFLASKDIHKVLLWLLGQEITYKDTIIITLYNICFKSAAALKIYRKKQVIDLLKTIQYSDCVKQVYLSLIEALEQPI